MLIRKVISFFKTKNVYLYCALRRKFKRAIITPYKKAHIACEPGSKILGDGQLLFGIQWDLGIYHPSQLVLRSNSRVTVNQKFLIYSGASIWINEGATLTLGSGYINNNVNISCYSNIQIGNNVAISENVTIRDSDNHSLNDQPSTKPITIGDHVWVGMNSTILKGVNIGSGSVIAAGSIVTRDIPENSLAAGVPAKVIKNNISWT